MAEQQKQKPKPKATSQVVMQAIDEIFDLLLEQETRNFIHDVGYLLRNGDLDEELENPSMDHTMISAPGVDIFGQPLNKTPCIEINCPKCNRIVGSSRFTPHLEKCMGIKGRMSSRVARQRICTLSNAAVASTIQANTNIGNSLTDKPRRNSTDSVIPVSSTSESTAKNTLEFGDVPAKSRRNSMDAMIAAPLSSTSNSTSAVNENTIKSVPNESQNSTGDMGAAAIMTSEEVPAPVKLTANSILSNTIASGRYGFPIQNYQTESQPMGTAQYQALPVPAVQSQNPERPTLMLGLYEDISGTSNSGNSDEDEFEDVNEMVWEEPPCLAKSPKK